MMEQLKLPKSAMYYKNQWYEQPAAMSDIDTLAELEKQKYRCLVVGCKNTPEWKRL